MTKQLFFEEHIPVNERECSVRVPLTNVTGPKPAVLGKDSFVRVEVRSLVVPFRNRRTTNANLSLLNLTGSGVAGVGHIKELDLNGRHRQTNGSVAVEFRRKNSTHSA